MVVCPGYRILKVSFVFIVCLIAGHISRFSMKINNIYIYIYIYILNEVLHFNMHGANVTGNQFSQHCQQVREWRLLKNVSCYLVQFLAIP